MSGTADEMFHRPPSEEASGDFRSSLASRQGHGSKYEKRASVAKIFETIKEIMKILPEPARQEIGRDIANIRENPEAAVEIIRGKLGAYRAVIDMLDNSMTTDEALAKLTELFPEKREKVQ